MSAFISQREARRLKKRVAQLEQQDHDRRARWSVGYPGGINFATITIDPDTTARCGTAQLLEHAIVVRVDERARQLLFYALKVAT